MRYLLTRIDVFSKRAWAVPIVDAFEKILSDKKCYMVQSDKSKEFLNATFQSMLQSRGIHFYTSKTTT